jgi:hypothetical protein
MRTTVTIDPDTEHLLKEQVKKTGMSFKQVLNQSIRKALGGASKTKRKLKPLFNHPFPKELDTVSMNRLADEWDDEETARELHR